MASIKEEDYSKIIRIPIPDKLDESEELLKFGDKYCRVLLAVYGKETKILINKRELEKILNDLPEDSNSYKPYKKNFYLVRMTDGNNTKIYIEDIDKKEDKPKHGEEIKILMNRKGLEDILKNIPENCPICKSKFSENNFYLVDISSGCSTENYIECLCGNYRDVVVEMR